MYTDVGIGQGLHPMQILKIIDPEIRQRDSTLNFNKSRTSNIFSNGLIFISRFQFIDNTFDHIPFILVFPPSNMIILLLNLSPSIYIINILVQSAQRGHLDMGAVVWTQRHSMDVTNISIFELVVVKGVRIQ